MKTKTFAEDEVVDFGIQMSEMLETLEAKNIFHGNISPKNIFVTADGRYKIGGFTDFEGKMRIPHLLHLRFTSRKMLTIQQIFILSE